MLKERANLMKTEEAQIKPVSFEDSSPTLEEELKRFDEKAEEHFKVKAPKKKRATKKPISKKKKKEKNSFTFIDLFAGIGGMRIAFEKNNNVCVFSSEWDKYSQKTYKENFGKSPRGDITKIESDEIPDFNILVAGFPCQPFSTIGKREGFLHETQGTLFYDIERILKDKNPLSFLLENVPGLVNHDDGNTFKVILKTLKGLGYKVYKETLNSADFGVPQIRKRIYIVGFREDICNSNFEFSFPKSANKDVYINEFLEKDVTGYSISKHLQEVYLFKKDDGRPQIIDSKSKVKVKTLVSTYHKIQRLTGTFVRGGETGLRLLTAKECKAIMGFPDDFEIPVSRTQMYRQFGNSVAIPVVQEIAKKITEKLHELNIKQKNKAKLVTS